MVWLPKIVSEIGLKAFQELGYTLESDHLLQSDENVRRRLVSFASSQLGARCGQPGKEPSLRSTLKEQGSKLAAGRVQNSSYSNELTAMACRDDPASVFVCATAHAPETLPVGGD